MESPKSIFELLQAIRKAMLEVATQKSGYNRHLNFKYFELADFVPHATKLFAEAGICPIFSITYDANGIEMAVMKLVKGAETIVFSCPVERPANMSGTQAIGACITYYRRYLYMMCLDLVENDIIDATLEENKPTVEEKKATAKQIENIKRLYSEERQANMMSYYKVNTLEELTMKQASEALAKVKNG